MKLTVRLAHNDKRERDRAFRSLRKWLQHGAGSKVISSDPVEALKLWKALYYCMWNADKQHVQLELADGFASLLHCFPVSAAPAWLHAFWTIVENEWTMMDQYRIDKYFALMRRIVRQTFEFLRDTAKWDPEIIAETLKILNVTCLRSGQLKHRGVALHVVDVYMPELIGAAAESERLSWNALLELFRPLNYILQNGDADWLVAMRITETGYAAIFQELAVESDESQRADLHCVEAGEEEEKMFGSQEAGGLLLSAVKLYHSEMGDMFKDILEKGTSLNRTRRDDLKDLEKLYRSLS